MKKTVIASIIVMMVLGMSLVFATGNGAPSGKHFNLNIIGVPNAKNVNFDGGNGARIFVLRTGITKFYVQGGDSFEIRDHDGTDGEVGTGPNPNDPNYEPGIVFPYDPCEIPTWRVQIWVRLLGPKGSEVNWRSYYWDGISMWVLWDSFTLRKDTPPKFTEKTGSLLADGYRDMLWELEPVTKFRICQMRIFLLDE